MRLNLFPLSFLFAIFLGITPQASAQKQTKPLAGWFDAYPEVKLFVGQSFRAPVLSKTKDGQAVYSQTLRYDAPTGLVRAFDFTLLRDPAIKLRYSAESLRAQDDPPKESKVGGYRAWTWKDDKVAVILDDDKAVIITKAPQSVAGFPFEQADKGAWDKIASVLKDPPRTDWTLTVELFQALKKGSSTLAMEEWCGHANEVKPRADAPGSFLWTYRLADGSRILVGAAGRIEFVRHETKDGKVVDLVK